MKRVRVRVIVMVIIFLTILSTEIFANNSMDFQNVMEVEYLIKSGLEKNEFMIKEKASKLSMNEKMMIVSRNEKSAGVPFALNFFLGLGIGSYVQGDITGGLIATTGQLGGYLIFASGVASEDLDVASTGLLVMLGTGIYSWIRPFTYNNNYNKRLNQTVLYSYDTKMLNKNISLALEPNIDIKNINEDKVAGIYGLKLTLNY